MRTLRLGDSFRWGLLLLCLLGTASVAIVELTWGRSDGSQEQAIAASSQMQAATETIAAHRSESGPALDSAADLNGTGLIGAQFTSMTTTVGSLEAKRTTTNPNLAGLMVHLLDEAGVREGDFIGVGASGSFPGLILATLCAAEDTGLDVGLIVSLGASQWGANLPSFTWLDIEDVVYGRGMLPYRSAAATVGGDLDIGRDLDPETRALLRSRIDASGAILIEDPDLASNVATRMAIYRELAGDRRIAAFVNIGGAWANLGTDAAVLTLSPGLSYVEFLPPSGTRGVVYSMAGVGVPIIHLLNIKELAQRFGLPWDPSPLPEPASLHIEGRVRIRTGVVALGGGYLGIVIAWLVWARLGRKRTAGLDESESQFR